MPVGDGLVVGTSAGFLGPDPGGHEGSFSVLVDELVFDPLMRFGEDAVPRPWLLESLDRGEGGLRWIGRLRRGVRFHSGRPLTSRDAVETLRRVLSHGARASDVSTCRDRIEAISPLDPEAFQITLRRPCGILPALLSVGVVPGGRTGGLPDGTGPYKIAEWGTSNIRLDSNPDWWGPRPRLAQIEIKIVPTPEEVWGGLLRGEFDLIYPLDPRAADFLKEVPFVRVASAPSGYYRLVLFNLRRPLFRDVRVRRALNLAVDRQRLMARALLGRGRPCAGPIAGEVDEACTPEACRYQPSRALQLLRQAGWRRGRRALLERGGAPFRFDLLYEAGNREAEDTVGELQNQLLDVGVMVVGIPVSIPDLIEKVLPSGAFDAVLHPVNAWKWAGSNRFFWSSGPAGGGNISGYADAAVDEALEAMDRHWDDPQWEAGARRFVAAMESDPPGIFLYEDDLLYALHRRYRGVPRGGLRFPLYSASSWWVPRSEQVRRP